MGSGEKTKERASAPSRLEPNHTEADGARHQTQGGVVGRQDEIRLGLLVPEKCRGQMDRIQGPEDHRQGLRRPRQDGPGGLHIGIQRSPRSCLKCVAMSPRTARGGGRRTAPGLGAPGAGGRVLSVPIPGSCGSMRAMGVSRSTGSSARRFAPSSWPHHSQNWPRCQSQFQPDGIRIARRCRAHRGHGIRYFLVIFPVHPRPSLPRPAWRRQTRTDARTLCRPCDRIPCPRGPVLGSANRGEGVPQG